MIFLKILLEISQFRLRLSRHTISTAIKMETQMSENAAGPKMSSSDRLRQPFDPIGSRLMPKLKKRDRFAHPTVASVANQHHLDEDSKQEVGRQVRELRDSEISKRTQSRDFISYAGSSIMTGSVKSQSLNGSTRGRGRTLTRNRSTTSSRAGASSFGGSRGGARPQTKSLTKPVSLNSRLKKN